MIRQLLNAAGRRLAGCLSRREFAPGQRGLSIGGGGYWEQYDTARLRYRWPEWGALPKEAKVARLRDIEPEASDYSHNVTTDEYLDAVRLTADPDSSQTTIEGTHIAYGTDGSDPVASDNGVRSPASSSPKQHTDTRIEGRKVEIILLLSESEANGTTIKETGALDNGESTSVNVLTWDNPPDKNENKTLQLGIEVFHEPF